MITQGEGEERAVASTQPDTRPSVSARRGLVLKQFFLNLREMGIIRYETKTLLRRRDDALYLCHPYQMRPVGTDAAMVSHTGRGMPGVSGAIRSPH